MMLSIPIENRVLCQENMMLSIPIEKYDATEGNFLGPFQKNPDTFLTLPENKKTLLCDST